MAYEILMPQLSDSMDEGKLISWKVKEGESVKKGDVIAEVESDKAIMEVQSFKDGTVEELAVKEGETLPVGTMMARIDTDSTAPMTTTKKSEEKPLDTPTPKVEEVPKETAPKPTNPPPQEHSFLDDILGLDEYHDSPVVTTVKGDASPKAKAAAARYNLDITSLQQGESLPTPAHENDIKAYHLSHYFTPKARKLLAAYHLESTLFSEDKKHDSAAILAYIEAHDIPLPQPLDAFQKALISAVEASAKKPIYHIYDRIDASEMKKHKEHTMTVWLIKLIAKAMMAHAPFRSRLKNETIMIAPNASISLAVSAQERLYMPVFKDANLLTPSTIDKTLKSYEQKAQNATMGTEDMQGATFGISNLGMLGIERFDAMINKDECGIAAIGSIVDGAIMITLTLDHRLINGYQGAQFMQTLKSLALDAQNFKDV